MKLKTIFISLIFCLFTSPLLADQTPSPKDAKVYFINLKNGDTVKSPFLVQFGLKGMGVAPAGLEKAKTGHHHLIINEKIEG